MRAPSKLVLRREALSDLTPAQLADAIAARAAAPAASVPTVECVTILWHDITHTCICGDTGTCLCTATNTCGCGGCA